MHSIPSGVFPWMIALSIPGAFSSSLMFAIACLVPIHLAVEELWYTEKMFPSSQREIYIQYGQSDSDWSGKMLIEKMFSINILAYFLFGHMTYIRTASYHNVKREQFQFESYSDSPIHIFQKQIGIMKRICFIAIWMLQLQFIYSSSIRLPHGTSREVQTYISGTVWLHQFSGLKYQKFNTKRCPETYHKHTNRGQNLAVWCNMLSEFTSLWDSECWTCSARCSYGTLFYLTFRWRC